MARDEAIYSVIGKNIDEFKLYGELYDHKPPGMFLTTFLSSKFPVDQFFINRFLVFFSTLLTAFLTMKISDKLFNPKKGFLLYIPLFYILFSFFYLGGLIPLVETFETLFIVLSIFIFLKSKEGNYQEKHLLILASLSLFIAFQYKQTAIIFLLIPTLFLMLERKYKELLLFLSTFAVASIFLLIILNYLGIFNSYIDLVWFYGFERAGIEKLLSISKTILPLFFILPLLILSIPGIFFSLKKNKTTTHIILLTSACVLFAILFYFSSFSSRFYFLEFTPLLLLFIPLTIQSFSKQNKILKLLIILSIIFLLLFSIFLFSKVLYFFDGYNSLDNISDVLHLESLTNFCTCTNIMAPVDYWYLSSSSSSDVKYILGSWNLDYILSIETIEDYNDGFAEYLTQGGTCYVNYQLHPFYSIPGVYDGSHPDNPLFNIVENRCTCKYIEQKSANSAICYDCK